MAKRRIPLFDLTVPPASRREVDAVLRSGWLNTGSKASEFEKAIGRIAGVKRAVAVSSATAGLQLTLEALGIGAGSEVITTPFTFAATAAVVYHTGAAPVFADIENDTYNLDPDEVERKITSRTAAVMPVDIAGHPADYERLAEICDRRKVPLIADAAHSLGATLKRRSSARWADAAVYSFQVTKNLTTGDGGMVLSRHQPLADRVRLLSQHAMTSSAFRRQKSKAWEYDIVGLGHKANMTDVQAALGLGQIDGFKASQEKRAKLAERYISNLEPLADRLVLPSVRKHCRHGWHLFIVRLRLSQVRYSRNGVIRRMAEAGIECGVHYRPLFEMSLYKELGFSPQHLPNAAYVGRRVLSLPMYPGLRFSDVDFICDRLAKILSA